MYFRSSQGNEALRRIAGGPGPDMSWDMLALAVALGVFLVREFKVEAFALDADPLSLVLPPRLAALVGQLSG
ncbi:MAG: hypothetical protein QOD13_1733 [Thermoleophilaceae bacterium]|nr:hypothetical protein [Thermoleophilaceae bacterium]